MECSLNCRKLLSKSIDRIEDLQDENKELKKENELLKEELKELKDGIEGIYNNMISLQTINKYEYNNEEIEVL